VIPSRVMAAATPNPSICEVLQTMEFLGCNLNCDELIEQRNPCFNDVIGPVINFGFFEDPKNVLDLRPVLLTHKIPNTTGNGVPTGGSIQLFAMQSGVDLSARRILIATKTVTSFIKPTMKSTIC
jgi:hypothetical protein